MLDEEEATGNEGEGEGEGATEPTVEDRAREAGWRSKEEYSKLKGADPDKWVDAETFIKRGEESLPIIRAENRKLRDEMKEMKSLVRDVLKNQTEDRERAVKDALTKLKSEKRTAVEEADPAKVDAIDKQIDKLNEGAKPVVEKEAAGLPEEFSTWATANPWFKKDPTLRGLAIGHFDLLTVDEPDMSDAEKLKAVKAEVMRRYPEKFTNPKRKEAPAVEGANGAPRNGGGKRGYADLPQEAKDMADRLVRQKVLKNREEYLQSYQW